MGREVAPVRRADAAKAVLEFYARLGIERLPLELPETKARPVRRAAPEKAIKPTRPLPKTSTASAGGLHVASPAPPVYTAAPRPASTLSPDERAAELAKLREEVGDCRRCKLSEGRTHLVFGEGSPAAEIMFIGEGPGREEDIEGRPFVGEAGRLLTSLITKMGLRREEVYIGNVVKCRPPGNRDPEDVEIATCMPFITRQIEIISPRVIMALGRHAAHALTGTKTPISRMRGGFLDWRGIMLMPTFHPAYLLRNPKDKHLVWEDALKVLAALGRRPPQ